LKAARAVVVSWSETGRERGHREERDGGAVVVIVAGAVLAPRARLSEAAFPFRYGARGVAWREAARKRGHAAAGVPGRGVARAEEPPVALCQRTNSQERWRGGADNAPLRTERFMAMAKRLNAAEPHGDRRGA
jgi:hypothetical protein